MIISFVVEICFHNIVTTLLMCGMRLKKKGFVYDFRASYYNLLGFDQYISRAFFGFMKLL